MTKMIEHTLNLPSMDDIIKSNEPVVDQEDDDTAVQNYGMEENDLDAVLEAASQKLAMLNGDGHAEAMDVIHDDTLKHARDLMDLGYNVDQRSAATIFEKANMLYKTALDAKHSKRDMQLKAMKLALDQKKLDLEEQRLKYEMGDRQNVVDAEATMVMDRNDFVKKWREQQKEQEAIEAEEAKGEDDQ